MDRQANVGNPILKQLTVAGRPEVMEMGPILYAAQHDVAGKTVVIPGGVPNLFKPPGDSMAVTGNALDSFAGHAHLAGNSETQALSISLKNPDLRILMTVSEGLYGIVGRRSAGIQNLADLRGKRIGTFVGTSAAYFLHRMLRTVGMSESDVTIVPVGLKEITDALVAGKVDAIAIWEPESTRAKELIGSDAIEFSDPSVYRELYNLNTTAAALSDPTMRHRIVAFVSAVIEASKISTQSPQPVWELTAAGSGYDVALVGKVWARHRFPATLPSDLLDVLAEEEVWLAKQAGREPRARNELARLIDGSVLMDAQTSNR